MVWERIYDKTPLAIAFGDLNGDGKVDLIGSFKDDGIWYIDLDSNKATQYTTGKVENFIVDDLLAVFNMKGVWVNYAGQDKWVKYLENTPDDLTILKYIESAEDNKSSESSGFKKNKSEPVDSTDSSDYQNPVTGEMLNGPYLAPMGTEPPAAPTYSDTYYLYGAGNELLAEYDGSGLCTREYIYMGGRLIAEYRPGNAVEDRYFYYMTDQINTNRMLLNEKGVVVYSKVFGPYGRVLKTPENEDAPNGQFSGKERGKKTGLDYFGARYYDHHLARFNSVDPIINKAEAMVNPQAWNLYAYCGNNPITYFDPDGRMVLAIPAIVAITKAAAAYISSNLLGWTAVTVGTAAVITALNNTNGSNTEIVSAADMPPLKMLAPILTSSDPRYNEGKMNMNKSKNDNRLRERDPRNNKGGPGRIIGATAAQQFARELGKGKKGFKKALVIAVYIFNAFTPDCSVPKKREFRWPKDLKIGK